MRETEVIAGLRAIDAFLRRPGDQKPTASSIALAITAQTGKRFQPRLIAAVLRTAGVQSTRKAPAYGFDSAEILAALREGGGLDTLESQLQEVNAV